MCSRTPADARFTDGKTEAPFADVLPSCYGGSDLPSLESEELSVSQVPDDQCAQQHKALPPSECQPHMVWLLSHPTCPLVPCTALLPCLRAQALLVIPGSRRGFGEEGTDLQDEGFCWPGWHHILAHRRVRKISLRKR